MPDLALVTANQINIVGVKTSVMLLPGVAGVDVVAGQAAMIDPTTGNFVLATSNRVLGVVGKSCRAGGGLTLVRYGLMEGWDLSALNYDDPVYLNTANGNLATTGAIVVGRVYPGLYNLTGHPADKLLLVQLS